MATVIITIPDTDLPEISDAFAARFSYNAATDGTKAQFAKFQIIRFIRNTLKDYRRQNTEITINTNVDAINIT